MKNVPLINNIQKIVIYETKARFYVVGSNNIQTKFRILKIDRTEPRDLVINDDENEYSRKEIRELLLMIEMGNQPKHLKYNSGGSTGLRRTISAFGIVGFVRFLEGFYMVLITKRRRVSLMGPYTIFKVEDTVMLPIANESVKYAHPDEQKYVKMFQNVDLSSNFYFSYSYDLTQTLQYNLTPCIDLPNLQDLQNNFNHGHPTKLLDINSEYLLADSTSISSNQNEVSELILNNSANESVDDNANRNTVEEASIYIPPDNDVSDNNDSIINKENVFDDKHTVLGVKNEPHWKFVWNKYLLDPIINHVKHDWLLFLIHGFIGQSNICIFGKSVYFTLIARRSNKFAGTRFLKRGANLNGNVANEVETEQIIYDASISNYSKIHFTSFVQLRGSIPLHWSQDVSKIVPKPTILIDQADPYGHISGQHFNRLFTRYGAPIIILDLVKRKERKKHESLISDEFFCAIQYLNKFLPVEQRIQYIGFDMARANKAKNSNVLHKLSEIAEFCLKKSNFFNSRGGEQCGVVRTNCVDCLDRTNTAQFAIGKRALALQLYALGIIDSPTLQFDTDCLRILEDLYEDVGDTLALQYGGSQLVHRIRGYRKVSPWTSSSRDIMQTLSRYCRNTFSDNEKQQAINLFLGIFRPQEGRLNIWDLTTDFYLHNLYSPSKTNVYTQWFGVDVIKTLPKPYSQVNKSLQRMLAYEITLPSDDKVNAYFEYYSLYELSAFDELYVINMPNSIRDFMPKYAESSSAFTRRVWPRRGNETGNSTGIISSNLSTGSESGTSGSEDDDCNLSKSDDSIHRSVHTNDRYATFKELFRKSDKLYGESVYKLNQSSKDLYNSYLSLGSMTNHPQGQNSISYKQKYIQCNNANVNSTLNFNLSAPSAFSHSVYTNYIEVGRNGPNPPSKHNLQIYAMYLSSAR